MRPVSATVSIDAPREEVHSLLRDLSVRPAFTDHFIDDYRLQRIDAKGVGAAARFRLSDAKVRMDTVIEADEPPHLLRERGAGGRGNRIPVFTVWELAPGPGASDCEVTVTFWTEPKGPFEHAGEILISKRKLRRGWERALKRLRELAETGAPAERVRVAGADRIPHFVS